MGDSLYSNQQHMLWEPKQGTPKYRRLVQVLEHLRVWDQHGPEAGAPLLTTLTLVVQQRKRIESHQF